MPFTSFNVFIAICTTEFYQQMTQSNGFNGNDLMVLFNVLSANLTKWSNTLKQFIGKLPTNCLSAFDHFVKLARRDL